MPQCSKNFMECAKHYHKLIGKCLLKTSNGVELNIHLICEKVQHAFLLCVVKVFDLHE
jgi:hypothetical protein